MKLALWVMFGLTAVSLVLMLVVTSVLLLTGNILSGTLGLVVVMLQSTALGGILGIISEEGR